MRRDKLKRKNKTKINVLSKKQLTKLLGGLDDGQPLVEVARPKTGSGGN